MAPQPPPRPPKNDEDTIAHQNLLNSIDIYSLPKPFRSPTWKPNQRRNKNLKTILGDANRTRGEAGGNTGVGNSAVGTNDNSGIVTPVNESGINTPSGGPPTTGGSIDRDGDISMTGGGAPRQTQTVNFAEAEKSLSKLVLSKSLVASGGANQNQGSNVSVTYTNIESAPSLAHAKHYCDITGLPAPYTDPKTRLRYHNKEVFGVVRGMGQGTAEGYLEARGAHVVLK